MTPPLRSGMLYPVVSVCGAVVLALEILGTRILGPFYGVGLFLWSALITVTLAALSAGYLVGGMLADRRPSASLLFGILAVAGAWVVAIPWIREPFLHLEPVLGLRGAVLTSAAVLFFPPLALLGMVSPFAVKLGTRGLESVGRTAGRLYAVSTLAGVAAALLTGFVLIPQVGVRLLVVLLGLTLLATAALGMFTRRRSGTAVALLVALLPGAYLAVGAGQEESADPDRGVLEVAESPYGELRVVDMNETRHLLIDGGIHSTVDVPTGTAYHQYTAVMELPRYFYPGGGRVLLIGLGGGSLARLYAEAGWEVDAVEIDGEVVRLAREYFGLQEQDAAVSIMDGRQYLAATGRSYDVVLLDAFGSSSIPFHLTTVEAFRLAASRLKEDGLCAVNLEAVGWKDPLVGLIGGTLREVFPHVLALPMAEPPDRLGNVILLASRRPLEPMREPERNNAEDPNWRYGPGYARVHAWDNAFPPPKGYPLLTDDRNPVELFAEPVNRAARAVLHEYFGGRVAAW